jgi:hypothetical protein
MALKISTKFIEFMDEPMGISLARWRKGTKKKNSVTNITFKSTKSRD